MLASHKGCNHHGETGSGVGFTIAAGETNINFFTESEYFKAGSAVGADDLLYWDFSVVDFGCLVVAWAACLSEVVAAEGGMAVLDEMLWNKVESLSVIIVIRRKLWFDDILRLVACI
ncbi:hypothetical protein WICPIJ_003479 [Wickerhamomyces pijperi]|uniref:Uncharacterized protein n=1 Tax=Wickerhamomyces pijperi TaxID=599730 RepID=A0A9P8Q7B3_WICPI|nr:hypothetical protein WICPIJ_003479 [Wickerhamomyces pijperi]